MTQKRVTLQDRRTDGSLGNLLYNLTILSKNQNLTLETGTGKQTLMGQLDAGVYETLHLTNFIICHFFLPSSGFWWYFLYKV
jgi:hypothetical protein